MENGLSRGTTSEKFEQQKREEYYVELFGGAESEVVKTRNDLLNTEAALGEKISLQEKKEKLNSAGYVEAFKKAVKKSGAIIGSDEWKKMTNEMRVWCGYQEEEKMTSEILNLETKQIDASVVENVPVEIADKEENKKKIAEKVNLPKEIMFGENSKRKTSIPVTEKEISKPELQLTLRKYYRELERVYGQPAVNIVDFYTMTPSRSNLEIFNLLKVIHDTGEKGIEIEEDLKEELVTIGLLHDLTKMVNSKGAVDETMLNYASAFKGKEFDTLIHLEDMSKKEALGGNDYVTRSLAAIDEEARNIYKNGRKGEVFNLEDPDLEKNIVAETGGSRLYFMIARDLYRVTAGEARYGIAGYANQKGEGNKKHWTIEKNGSDENGVFFRKALNKRKDTAGAVDETLDGKMVVRYWPELYKHLDPGVKSFWEKLWRLAQEGSPDGGKGSDSLFKYEKEIGIILDKDAGIVPRDYAILSVEALRALRLGRDPEEVDLTKEVLLKNELDYKTWMEDVGAVAKTMSKENQFLSSPNFKSFQSTIGADYYPVIGRVREGGKKLNREQYLLERLGDLVEFSLKTGSMSPSTIATELEEYRKSGFLFKNEKELVDFMKRFKIPITNQEKEKSNFNSFKRNLVKGDSQQRKEAGKVVGNVVGGILKEIFK